MVELCLRSPQKRISSKLTEFEKIYIHYLETYWCQIFHEFGSFLDALWPLLAELDMA